MRAVIIRQIARMAPLGLVCALMSGNCFAYIDPNAGGLFFQLLLPMFIAVGAAWSLLKQRVFQLVSRLFGRGKKGG